MDTTQDPGGTPAMRLTSLGPETQVKLAPLITNGYLRLRSMLNPTCLPPIQPSACLIFLPCFVTLAERSTFPGTQDANPITAPA
jgi:hypothetical protein